MAKILVVDDRVMNREFLVTLLKYGQHCLLEASDGAEALKISREELPDLIITDILMPTMDGYALVEKLKLEPKLAKIPVIFYTATYRLEEGRQLADSCGVKYVLPKPCDPEMIIDTVNRALGIMEKIVVAAPTQKARAITAVQNRLISIAEFNFNLIAERDPLKLLKIFCEGACKLIGAKYGALGIFHYNNEGLKHFIETGVKGTTPLTQDYIIVQIRKNPVLMRKGHLIAVPFLTTSNLYGFFYVMDKNDGTDFSEEEVELVNLFSEEVTALYENIELYDAIQRHAANLQIERAKAEDASNAKSVFLATVSHELRTPLTAIIGYSEILEEMAKEDGLQPYAENLEKVIYSSKHLLNLINDILDLSKIEAGRMDVYLEEVNIQDLVKNLSSFMQPLLKKNNNTFALNIKTDEMKMVTDAMRVQQSLLNLLNNASKFTKKGKISLDVVSSNSMIQFIVRDTGIGVATDHIAKLFQSFSQGDSRTTRKYGGTGLGLYLTKCFCEMLGGNISVESQEGKGATFTITLPQKSLPNNKCIDVSAYQSKNKDNIPSQGKQEGLA